MQEIGEKKSRKSEKVGNWKKQDIGKSRTLEKVRNKTKGNQNRRFKSSKMR